MTTSVEILLKELPPVSQTGDRFRKPDASSVGSSHAQERTSGVSNNSNKKYEKSFSDHLDDHTVRTKKASDSKNVAHSENHHADKKVKQDKASPDEVEKSDNKSSTASEKTEISNKEEQKNTFDEAKVEQSTTAQVDAIKADQNNVNEINENIPIKENNTGETVQGAHNIAETSIDPEELIADNNVANNKNAQAWTETAPEIKNSSNGNIPFSSEASASEGIEGSERKSDENQPEIAEPNQNKHSAGFDVKVGSNHAKSQIDKTANAENTQNPDLNSSKNEFSNFVHESQNEQKEIRSQYTEAGKNSDDQNIALPDNNLPQEAGTLISEAAKLNPENSSQADVNAKQPVPNNDDGGSNAETPPQAAIQNASNDQRLGSANKIDEDITSSAKEKKFGQISANSTTTPTKENQSTATSSASQNAAKSEIQLDLGMNGQKFETLLPQNNPVNGQPHIANGSLLIAQQVHAQNEATHQIGVLKADNPAMARMINEQITVAINRNIGGGHNNFTIRLHPVELGQVDVKVEFLADGKMHASMMVESEKTLSMLQRDQHSLGRALQDAGINLSQKEMSFSLMKQSQEQNSQQFTSSGRQFSEPMKSEEFIQPELSQYVNLGYSNQAIDISV